MAKIIEYKDILLDDLTIGTGQARVQDVGKEIEDLVESIKTQGLLQPIVVCPARNADKWEILTGQRRFLAHRMLKRESITAAILDKRVEEHEAKAISITENLIRRGLSNKDLIDGVTYLHKVYGNAKAVADTTGLPYPDVLKYVKYPRLSPELKEMVDTGQVNVPVALKAEDAATDANGVVDVEAAVTLAQAMEPMTGPQQEKLAQERKKNPDRPIDDVVEDARTGSKVVQVVATVTQETHTALQQFAKAEGIKQDEAAATLLVEALIDRDLLEE